MNISPPFLFEVVNAKTCRFILACVDDAREVATALTNLKVANQQRGNTVTITAPETKTSPDIDWSSIVGTALPALASLF